MKKFDEQEIRHFYEPHPQIYGSQMLSPPLDLVIVANSLNGRSMSVYEAESKLAAANKEGRLIVNAEKGHICLEMPINDKPYDAGHTFIIIKFH